MTYFFRLLLTLNATSLIGVVYLIKQKILITKYFNVSFEIPENLEYVLYFLIPLLTTLLSLWMANFLDTESIEKNVLQVEQANNAYLPSYLGYFFVALSITDSTTFIYVYSILFVFTFLSQTLYFNPLFLLYGYKFYYIVNSNNVRVFVITRKNLKLPETAKFPKLYSINNFTFIDKEL